MGKTALQLVQSACYSANIPAPSALVGATDAGTLQLIELFYDTGRELRNTRAWPQLKKNHFIILEAGRTQYPLPADFFSAVPASTYDQANQWDLDGPLPDSMWNYRARGLTTGEIRRGYRVFGPDSNTNDSRGQFYVDPTPGDGQALEILMFEYFSKSWLLPPNWTASTTYAANTYTNSNGQIYKVTAGGGGASGTVSPNFQYGGIGQDGGVFWQYLTTAAWQAATTYAAGTYVTNGGNLYVATDSGTSAGSGGPTGTTADTDITDSGVTWRYKAAPTWAAYTEYGEGDHVVKSAKYYRAIKSPFFPNSAQKSGATGPTWTATTIADNALTQTLQTAAYEALVTDSDLCLFDDELMTAGLKYRFLQARGLMFQPMQAEYERLKSRAASRWNSGGTLRIGNQLSASRWNLPEGDFYN